MIDRVGEGDGGSQLSDIDDQRIGSLIADYMICRACGVVDRDPKRMQTGNACRVCGVVGNGGLLAFDVNVHITLDLLQEMYHAKATFAQAPGVEATCIGTVLMYCTLREILLNHFLSNRLDAQGVSQAISKRLFADNKLAAQRFGPMFTAVVGCTWGEAVRRVSDQTGIDYLTSTSETMKRAASIRNQFLHEGSAWTASREFATECLNDAGSLIGLFVALHNEFVHPLRMLRR